MYYSCALCSFWQTDLIKERKVAHSDKLSPTAESELAVSSEGGFPLISLSVIHETHLFLFSG